jgi:hypothetical protein
MKNPAGSKLGASPSLGLPGLAVDCLAPTLAPTWFPVVPHLVKPTNSAFHFKYSNLHNQSTFSPKHGGVVLRGGQLGL